RLMAECNLRGMIGKGNRSSLVVDSMRQNRAVYFAATGGAGALIAKSVEHAEIIAYEDLGPEAIYKLEVVNLALVVAIDADGNNLYENKN
ncbi:MAG: fumarate hydratase C-terminal domain-containing protein, partial [Victivallaceae bacterium]